MEIITWRTRLPPEIEQSAAGEFHARRPFRRFRLRRHHLWISFPSSLFLKTFIQKKSYFLFLFFIVSLCSAIASRNERFLRLRRFIIITPRFPCTWIKQNNKTDIIETTDVRISFFANPTRKEERNQSFNQTKEKKLSWTVHDWFLKGKIARRSLATMDETTLFLHHRL